MLVTVSPTIKIYNLFLLNRNVHSTEIKCFFRKLQGFLSLALQWKQSMEWEINWNLKDGLRLQG
jgi:hypothetical protein